MFTNFRIKFWRFFRKNKIIIFIVICILAIVIIINQLLKNYEPEVELQTTYTPHTSIIDTSDSVPNKSANKIEEMIEQYVKYCNESDFASAFNMLSSTCKEIEFENNLEIFMSYVYTKMPTPKKYSIQDYSNDGNTYIYQIKYIDDILTTGLTNSVYQYTEEKMVFKKTTEGIEMSVGNFIDYKEINNIVENEYIKIDVKSVTKYYSAEKYQIKLTNRSNYNIVFVDGYKNNELNLELESGDTRNPSAENAIVLGPMESKEVTVGFIKYYDNDDDSSNLKFNYIRVMEEYSGINGIDEQVINDEIQNAIAKFSATVSVKLEE